MLSFKQFFNGILNSYAQIFFSSNKVFAGLLLAVTFLNPAVGLSGLLCLLFTGAFAFGLGFDREQFRNGVYGFNSVLTGLLVGSHFNVGITMVIVVAFAAVASFVVTLVCNGLATRLDVPFLSLPFLVAGWTVIVASRSVHGLAFNDQNIYTYNRLWEIGGPTLVGYYERLSFLKLPSAVEMYLRSLGAVLFQYQLLAGMIICAGLIYSSRIAFLLSVVGFASGCFMQRLLTGSDASLNYTYAGYNFILTAIALGGIYFVPNIFSFLLAAASAAACALLSTALDRVFEHIGLPYYSLPFNAVVIGLLYAFQFRVSQKRLLRVPLQLLQPERNLYHYRLAMQRFGKAAGIDIALPFNGKWSISQAYNGNETHKDVWRHAFDFVIVDEHARTYKLPGNALEDFYCYGLPVTAVAAGTVVETVDGVEDNGIGEMDMTRNWGNTVVVRHKPDLYSKVSHLQKGTLKVKAGDEVKRGDVLALNGNSGRSPEPHLHFQMQAMPQVGAATVPYPFSQYLLHHASEIELKTNDTPQEHQTVSNIMVTELLRDAFTLPSRKRFTWSVRGHRREPYHTTWEVFTDLSNHPYLYCYKTGAVAYFQNSGGVFQFTNYYGDRDALLFHFYRAAYRIVLGYHPNLVVRDMLPLDYMHSRFVFLIQDWVAPFVVFTSADYELRYLECDNDAFPRYVRLESKSFTRLGQWVLNEERCEIELRENGISAMTFWTGDNAIEVNVLT